MTIFKVFWNSFFIQAAWSFKEMQAMGFAFCISPALKKIYKEKREFLSALKRHMEFFNTHPYMASPIVGAVISAEEDIKAGNIQADDVSVFKRSLMGPYGAIGDAYFWGALKPMAAVFSVILFSLSAGLWAGAVFLIIYNIPHLWMRAKGLSAGYSMGMDVAFYIKSLDIPEWGKRVRYFTICLLGVALAIYYQRIKKELPYLSNATLGINADVVSAIGIFGAVIFLSYLMRKGLSASMLVCLIFTLFAAYLYIEGGLLFLRMLAAH